METNKMDDSISFTSVKSKVLLLAIFVASCGFPTGYQLSVVSGAMLIIQQQFHLTETKQELIISVTIITAALFALLSGWINERFGRKIVIIAANIVFIIATIFMAASQGFECFLTGRLILGIAIGLSTSTVPAYMAETTPSHLRGVLLTLFPVVITFGQWMAGVASAVCSYISNSDIGWRLMISLGSITVLLQMLCFHRLPESPLWLTRRNRTEEAAQVLSQLCGNDDRMKSQMETTLQQPIVDNADDTKKGLFDLLKDPISRKALTIGCSLQMIQQLSGVNCVMFYAASIMKMAGIKNNTAAMWLGSLPGLINFLGTAIGAHFTEKFGRRKCIMYSTAGSTAALIVIAVSFIFISDSALSADFDEGSYRNGTFADLAANDSCSGLWCRQCSYHTECGFCYIPGSNSSGSCVSVLTIDDIKYTNKAMYGRCSTAAGDVNVGSESDFLETNAAFDYGFCTTIYSWLPVVALVIFMASFCLITTFTFLSLSRAITRQGIYFLYAGFSAFGLLFMYLFQPETRGISIDEIDSLLNGPWLYWKK